MKDTAYRLTVVWTSTALAVGVLLAIGRQIVPDVLGLVERTGNDPDLVAAALLAGTLAIWWAMVRRLGPIAASPAQQRWQVWPDPRSWQTRQRWLALAVAVPCAASVGYVVGLAATDPWPGVATGAALLIVTIVIALGQRRDGGPFFVRTAGALALGLLTASAWGTTCGVVIGVAVLPAALLGLRRRRRHGLVPRWNLAAAAQRRWELAAAATMLDPDVLRSTLAITRRGFPLTPPASATGRIAMLTGWRALRPTAIRVVVGLVVVAAVGDVLGTRAALLGAVVLIHVTTVATTRDLLAWRALPSVQRLLALDTRRAVAGFAAPCVVATIVVAGVVAVELAPMSSALVVLLVQPLVATWSRMAAADQPEELTMMSTPMGAVPIQVAVRLVAGTDATVIALIVIAAL